MQLYLIQHGIARSKNEDSTRSLTEKGKQEVTRIAIFLKDHIENLPGRILHSGKSRTRQTAEIIAGIWNAESRVEAVEDLSPMDDPVSWIERLKCLDDDLMLIGHLPHLSKLASSLLCSNPDEEIIDFKNAGIVCLKRNEEGAWTVSWMITPDIWS